MFIEIALRNPDDSDRFLTEIEYDGASYHSSQSARDRNCNRQEIFETMRWSIYEFCRLTGSYMKELNFRISSRKSTNADWLDRSQDYRVEILSLK